MITLSDFVVQVIPSVVQPVIIGMGLLKAVIKHTVKESKGCKDTRQTDYMPCVTVITARAHRFIAVLGLTLTALVAGIIAVNLYIRLAGLLLVLTVGALFAKYIGDEDDRMEKPPQNWYDRNKELILALILAVFGVVLSIASQVFQP